MASISFLLVVNNRIGRLEKNSFVLNLFYSIEGGLTKQ